MNVTVHLEVHLCQVLLVVQVHPAVREYSHLDLAHLWHLVDVKFTK